MSPLLLLLLLPGVVRVVVDAVSVGWFMIFLVTLMGLSRFDGISFMGVGLSIDMLIFWWDIFVGLSEIIDLFNDRVVLLFWIALLLL